MARAKSILVCLLLFLPIICSGEEDADKIIEIWSEDFTGWITNCVSNSEYTRTYGKNATYEYLGDLTIAFNSATSANGHSPELKVKQNGIFYITINLNGAYGKMNLSFKHSGYIKDINVWFSVNNKKDLDNKSKDGTKRITSNPDKSFTIEVPKNSKQLFIAVGPDASNSCSLDDFKLTASASCRDATTSPDLSYNNSDASAVLDEDFQAPILNNPNNVKVHFYSYDTSVAEVDGNGKVKINGTGETIIYAIHNTGTKYGYQEVSYKLKVNHKSLGNELYYESFDQNTCIGGYGKDFKYQTTTGTPILDNKPSKVNENCQPAYRCIQLGKSSDQGEFTTGAIPGLSCGTATLVFKLAKAGMSSSNIPTYNISITKGKIQTVKYVPTTNWSTTVYAYITEADATSNITIKGKCVYIDDVSVLEGIVTEKIPIKIGQSGYSSLYYSDRAFLVPDGMDAYTMKLQGNQIADSHVYQSGAIIPKSTAVILKAEAGDYQLPVSLVEGFIDNDNALRGSDTDTITTGGDTYYLLAFKDDRAGFYWGAENGKAFTNGAHKAYLALTSSQAKRIKSFVIHQKDETTGIGKITIGDENQSSYNLAGQRISSTYKGIVIRNGKKSFNQ